MKFDAEWKTVFFLLFIALLGATLSNRDDLFAMFLIGAGVGRIAFRVISEIEQREKKKYGRKNAKRQSR